MDKQNNRFLQQYQTMFAGFSSLQERPKIILDDFPRTLEGARMDTWSALELLDWAVKFSHRATVRILLVVDRLYIAREWFQADMGGTGWKLDSYNHESRTGIYKKDGLTVTLSASDNWAKCSDVVQFRAAYLNACEGFKGKFGFGFLSSPAMTSLYAIEQSLPKDCDASPLHEEIAQYLHQNTTQGRTEVFNEFTGMTRSFQHYDRVFAYAADCNLDMPVGSCRVVDPDTEPIEFKKYEPAFYLVDFWVPDGWNHVGLLPAKMRDGSGWFWPRRGFHSAFVAEPELRLAFDHGWRFRILQKFVFDGVSKPLQNWRKRLVEMWWEAKDWRKEAIEADIYRKILLFGIGGMYARSYKREQVIDAETLANRNDEAALTAEKIAPGQYRVESREVRGERFYMPHWTAWVWSWARRKLALRLLAIPYCELLGCHVDAVFCKSRLESSARVSDARHLPASDASRFDDLGESVGKFRLKGSLAFDDEQQVTRQNLAKWSELAKVASHVQ